MKKKALIVDANALLHRAWHALPPMTSPSGKLVNAAYGFASVMIKILASERPEVLAVCWDTPEPTFRHKALESYKAHREEQPDEFYDQVTDAQDIVTALGGTNVSLPGYEADDLFGTLAVRLEKDGFDVTILTGDKDAWQLISDDIHVLAFKKGVSETVLFTPESLLLIAGLRPDQIVDYKAMRGDASDNIPGIRGIGEKTATELLQSYGDLDGIMAAAHDEKSKIAPGVRAKLLAGEQIAQDTLPIVRIVTDAPTETKIDDLGRRLVDEKAVMRLFTDLGFKSLIGRISFSDKANSISDSDNDAEISRSTPKADKAKTAKKTKDATSVNATPRKSSAFKVAVDLKDFVAKARSAGTLAVFLPEVAQASLFQESPSLLLATAEDLLSLTEAAFKSEKDKKIIADILSDEAVKKIGHDLKRSCHWIAEHGMSLKGVGFDTELAAYLLAAGERGHDLNILSVMYLQRTLDQEVHAESLSAILDLVPILQGELEKNNLLPVFERMELPLITILSDMERYGIKIDVGYFKEVSTNLHEVKSGLEKDMQEMAKETFNPLSPKQLTHVLFDVLQISTKGIKRGKTGISTAAAELDKLHGVHPIIDLIERHRELSKLLSTYVDALPVLADKNGRVHTTFNQAVTATGRLSSSEPNMQNIPIRTELGRQVRRGFVASPGTVLLSCDYSQIELRIVAALAKDKQMLQAFERGEDIHTATAANIWGLELDKVTKDQRRVAKAINFGLIFGQGPQGLARSAEISFDEAKEFIARYFDAFSGVREWMELGKALAASQGYVETLFGRRRALPEIHSPMHMVRAQAERMAINMPVQGTEADLMKLAMIAVAEKLPEISSDTKMLLQVHDELVFEVPMGQENIVAEQVSDIMQHVEKIGCPIVVDAKVGSNWDEMKKI